MSDALIESPQQKKSKMELKREQIYRERVQRHLNHGLSPEQAVRKVEEEDWQRLNPHDKIDQVRGMLVGNLKGVLEDIDVLHKNQKELANIMDTNFRAFEMILGKLGVSDEELKKTMAECEAEVRAERQGLKAAQQVKTEEQVKEELAESVDQQATPSAPPPEATVFGG